MSSGSWSGGRGADILDLDRYMRPRESNRVPHNTNGSVDVSNLQPALEQRSGVCSNPSPAQGGGQYSTSGSALVVDSGGPGMMRPEQSNSMSSVSADMVKRYSHDSGVSDDSPRPARARSGRNRHDRSLSSDNYQRVTRRSSHKRQGRDNRETASSREDEPSLRAFRAECEKALREHKEQLQRVADICERLTCNQIATAGNSQPVVKKHQQVRTSTPGTLSSTSGSSSDGYSNQHPRDECKTYKIIMNKLDELNRLFKTRAVRPTPELRKGVLPPRATSDTVTVSDKVVATDPPPGERSGKQSPKKNVTELALGVRDNRKLPVNRFEDHSSGDEYVEETAMDSTRYPFNLEDPIQLYSQAKQLQINRDNQYKAAVERNAEKIDEQRSEYTMCAMCRRYWLSVKDAFVKRYLKY